MFLFEIWPWNLKHPFINCFFQLGWLQIITVQKWLFHQTSVKNGCLGFQAHYFFRKKKTLAPESTKTFGAPWWLWFMLGPRQYPWRYMHIHANTQEKRLFQLSDLYLSYEQIMNWWCMTYVICGYRPKKTRKVHYSLILLLYIKDGQWNSSEGHVILLKHVVTSRHEINLLQQEYTEATLNHRCGKSGIPH